MTKGKKVKFHKNVEEKEKEVGTKSRRFKEKHSLDSDEELSDEVDTNDDKQNILNEDDIEGQEDETIRNDDGIPVTPFNLKEELEEGHFDGQGNYIANKIDSDATDQWLESLDWNKIENQTYSKEEKKVNVDEPVLEPLKIMQTMVTIMKPGENVLKALRRLGGNKRSVSSADRWKKKKLLIEEPVNEKDEENKANLLKLTGLADDLLQGGDFQVYEKTYEQLNFHIKRKLSQFENAEEDEVEIGPKKARMEEAEDASEDDELEAAFNKSEHSGSVFMKKSIDVGKEGSNSKQDSNKNDTPDDKKVGIETTEDVRWMYKLTDDENAEHLGPLSSTDMLKMQEDGKFNDNVYCRKVGSNGPFYSALRMDFELYT